MAACTPTANDADHDGNRHVPQGYTDNGKKCLGRLKRIEGQARGLHRMVDQEQY